MLSHFDKIFLKEELFKELSLYQKSFSRSNVIGLIQIDNCMDSYSHDDYLKREFTLGNLHDGYRCFYNYNQKMESYLNLLDDDETIYPSLEDLFSSLFINGKYTFLNFTSFQDRNLRKTILENGCLCEIQHFEFNDEKNTSHISTFHTRIKIGKVIRFFSKKVFDVKHFNDKSCYLTLSCDDKNIQDDFKSIFKSLNFKERFNHSEPLEFTIHDLIKDMIKIGETYTIDNPTNENYDYRKNSIYFSDERLIQLVDSNNTILSDDFTIPLNINSLSVGDLVINRSKKYIITEIKSLKTTLTSIIVKEDL